MGGFGANYYDLSTLPSSFFVSKDTNQILTPDIVIGENFFVMEFSTLYDIAKSANTVVNNGEQAAWVCFRVKDINFWFASDNEMGGGNLTAIALSRDGKQKGCVAYEGDISVAIKNTPLLTASTQKLLSDFGKKEGDDLREAELCNDTKNYGDFTQLNCLRYYINNKKVSGVVITQITAN